MLDLFTKRRPKSISLKNLLFLPVLFALFALALVGYLSFRNGQQAVNDVAHQLRLEINSRIEEHLLTFLDIPVRINQANAEAFRRGVPDVHDQKALEHYFWEQIQLFDSVTSVNFGNRAGGLANAGREGVGGPLYVIATEDYASGAFHKFATDSYGNRGQLLESIPSFDARERSWYVDALKKERDVWSDVYILFTGQDMCLTVSRPVYDTDDMFLGVTAVNIFLSHLGDFLEGIKVGERGQSFIMERSGLMIASSTSEDPISSLDVNPQHRIEARESAISLTRLAAEALHQEFGDYQAITSSHHFEFQENREQQLGLVRPFQNPYGLEWLIVTVIPEKDFMAQVYRHNQITIGLILLTMLVFIALGIFITRRIIHPISELNLAAGALARGEWDQTIYYHGWIEEINALSHSFNHMMGKLQQMVAGLNQEIADRKEVEERLTESEKRFRAISELALDAIIMINAQGKVVYWSPSAERIFGHTSGDVVGRDVHRLLMPEKYRQSYERGFKTFKETGEGVVTNRVLELVAKHKSGKEIPIEIGVSPIKIKGEYWASAIIRDITERKAMEEKIEYQYEFHRIVATISSSFINFSKTWIDEAITSALYQIAIFFQVDRSYLFQFSSDAKTISMTHEWCAEGIEPQKERIQKEPVENQPWMMQEIQREEYTVIPDVDALDYEGERKEFQRQDIKSLICIPVKKDGEVFGFLGLDSVKTQKDWPAEEITLFKIIGEIISSIMARHQIEDELTESEARYRTLVSNIPGIVFRCDMCKDWAMRFMSEEIEELTEYPSSYFINNRVRSYMSLIHPQDQEEVFRVIQESISKKRAYTVQYRVLSASGKIRWVLENGQGVFDSQGDLEYIDGVIMEITERKKVEEKLAQRTQELEQELDKAKQVHQQMLPKSLPTIKGLSTASHYQPAKKLGGDFYDMIKVGHKLVFYLSDVSGHGLDGSMLSVFVKHTIKGYLSFYGVEHTPSSILQYLVHQFKEENYLDSYFICIFVGVLDLDTMELTYAGLGFQDTPFVKMGDGREDKLATKGLFVSSTLPVEMYRFQEKTITLTPGTTIFFNTDGLTEQGVGGSYYMERLPEVFYSKAHLSPHLISQAVVEDFRQFNKNTLQGKDDITFLVLQVEPDEMERYSFELASDFQELRSMQDKVLEHVEGSLDLDSVHSLRTCLTELVVNAMEHGNSMDPLKKVYLEMIMTEHYIQVVVEDEGDGFDWWEKIDRPLDLEGDRERGRGIAMTKLFCDHLLYNQKGNQATMFLINREEEE